MAPPRLTSLTWLGPAKLRTHPCPPLPPHDPNVVVFSLLGCRVPAYLLPHPTPLPVPGPARLTPGLLPSPGSASPSWKASADSS